MDYISSTTEKAAYPQGHIACTVSTLFPTPLFSLNSDYIHTSLDKQCSVLTTLREVSFIILLLAHPLPLSPLSTQNLHTILCSSSTAKRVLYCISQGYCFVIAVISLTYRRTKYTGSLRSSHHLRAEACSVNMRGSPDGAPLLCKESPDKSSVPVVAVLHTPR